MATQLDGPDGPSEQAPAARAPGPHPPQGSRYWPFTPDCTGARRRDRSTSGAAAADHHLQAGGLHGPWVTTSAYWRGANCLRGWMGPSVQLAFVADVSHSHSRPHRSGARMRPQGWIQWQGRIDFTALSVTVVATSLTIYPRGAAPAAPAGTRPMEVRLRSRLSRQAVCAKPADRRGLR